MTPKTAVLPVALASGVVMSGLTAPALRMALVLLSELSPTGGIDMLKPRLEKLAGVRLDNAERALNRLRDARFERGDDAPFVFDELNYTPGSMKRLAGVIAGRLSPSFFESIADPSWGGKTVQVDLDELRQLSTVPGILLWLRLAIERQSGTDQFRLRMRGEDIAPIFGPYLSRATISRKTAADGQFMWTSLSRMFTSIVAPAISDLHAVLPDHVVDATPITKVGAGKGVPWLAIDVEMNRISRRPSLREMAKRSRERDEYELRKRKPTDPHHTAVEEG